MGYVSPDHCGYVPNVDLLLKDSELVSGFFYAAPILCDYFFYGIMRLNCVYFLHFYFQECDFKNCYPDLPMIDKPCQDYRRPPLCPCVALTCNNDFHRRCNNNMLLAVKERYGNQVPINKLEERCKKCILELLPKATSATSTTGALDTTAVTSTSTSERVIVQQTVATGSSGTTKKTSATGSSDANASVSNTSGQEGQTSTSTSAPTVSSNNNASTSSTGKSSGTSSTDASATNSSNLGQVGQTSMSDPTTSGGVDKDASTSSITDTSKNLSGTGSTDANASASSTSRQPGETSTSSSAPTSGNVNNEDGSTTTSTARKSSTTASSTPEKATDGRAGRTNKAKESSSSSSSRKESWRRRLVAKKRKLPTAKRRKAAASSTSTGASVSSQNGPSSEPPVPQSDHPEAPAVAKSRSEREQYFLRHPDKAPKEWLISHPVQHLQVLRQTEALKGRTRARREAGSDASGSEEEEEKEEEKEEQQEKEGEEGNSGSKKNGGKRRMPNFRRRCKEMSDEEIIGMYPKDWEHNEKDYSNVPDHVYADWARAYHVTVLRHQYILKHLDDKFYLFDRDNQEKMPQQIQSIRCKNITIFVGPTKKHKRELRWYGRLKNGTKTEALNPEWIDYGFTDAFVKECKDKVGQWVTVTAQSAASPESIDPHQCLGPLLGWDAELGLCVASKWIGMGWVPPLPTGNPVVLYQQDYLGTCVFSSAASAFAYFGDTRAAQYLSYMAEDSLSFANPFQLLCDTLRRKPFSYDCQRTKKRKHLESAQHSDVWHCYVRVVQICAEDGGIEHAVAICNGWIFDSNLKHSLPWNRESLDWCCSVATQRVGFVGYTKNDYTFVPKKQEAWMRLPVQGRLGINQKKIEIIYKI